MSENTDWWLAQYASPDAIKSLLNESRIPGVSGLGTHCTDAKTITHSPSYGKILAAVRKLNDAGHQITCDVVEHFGIKSGHPSGKYMIQFRDASMA